MKTLFTTLIILGLVLVCFTGESYTALTIATTGWVMIGIGTYGHLRKNTK